MVSALKQRLDKKEYFEPLVEILIINSCDVIRTSPMNESNDNDFGAGGLGGFTD